MDGKKKFYLNVLVLSPSGAAFVSVDDRKAKWYLDRDLAKEVEVPEECPMFSRAIQFLFTPKGGGDDKFRTQFLESQCVVSGDTEDLTLHHVVPSVVRKHFPLKDKGHQHGWCVLLTRKNHDIADQKASKFYEAELNDLEKRIQQKAKKMRKKWAAEWIKGHGGIGGVKNLFREEFLKLDPKHLPEGFLKDH